MFESRAIAALTAGICLMLTACASEGKTSGGSCIAPANPGGGWDFSCRAVSQALGTSAPGGEVLRVVNIPGEGGGLAFKSIRARARDVDPVIVAASPSTLLGLAQHRYGQNSEHDVRWIAAVDAEPSIIAVSARAPWRNLSQFITAWRAHPDSVIIGGTSGVGGQDHMKMLLLARAAGLDVRRVRYQPVTSAAEAIAMVNAGSLQVFPAELSKMLPQVERKELRVLAVLDGRRAQGLLANVPTAREQGLDVVFVVWRGFYAPRGLNEKAYQQWVESLRTMSASPAWKGILNRNGLTPFFLGGKEFESFVTEQTAAYRNVSREIGIVQ
ncbi:MAG: tripartite tricarboxylate transporter substrate-binding protein [Gemmatimonadota bacterium]|nr:tripartite tricarboxylate transporter substrate-binding protein [Gemmatimonadota bacterium]